MNMFIDMTVGLLLLYALISMSRCMLRNSTYPLLKSGEYGSPPQVVILHKGNIVPHLGPLLGTILL